MENRFCKANFTSFSSDSDKIYEFSENSMKFCDFHLKCVQNKLIFILYGPNDNLKTRVSELIKKARRLRGVIYYIYFTFVFIIS